MSAPDDLTCEDFKEMAPAYGLAVLDDAERTACARHLAGSGPHRGCPEAVEEARQVTALLAAVVPARAPSPRVWRAIEARIADFPIRPVDPRRRMRELGGWIVASAVIAIYLLGAPGVALRRATAPSGGPSTAHAALGLMIAPGTRVVPFRAHKAGAGRATLIVNPAQHRALLLADQIPPGAAERLRLWGVRGPDVPTPIAPVPLVAGEGIAAADLGSSLFEPTPPDHLVLSADRPGATSPSDVLLTAETR